MSSETAEIQKAILSMFEAFQTENIDALLPHFHSKSTGFDADGGLLKDSESARDLQREFQHGMSHQFSVRNLQIELRGGIAIATGYLEMQTRVHKSGATVANVWRFSDIRVEEGGKWKLLHYHFSRLTYPR